MRKIIFPITVILVISVFITGCTGTGVSSSWPGITVNSDTIYTSYAQGVYAISSGNGSLMWRYPEKAGKSNFYAAPLVTPDGLVIVGDYNNELHGIDAKTGGPRWTFQGNGKWIAHPVLDGDVIYAPNSDRNLYALNLNGEVIWKFKTENLLWADPLILKGVVYQAGMDHFLYAIDANTGKQIWKVDCGGAIIGNPVNANGEVYIGTLANELLAIKTSTGTVIWRFKTGNAVWSGPSIKDGILYFGDLDGTLYAIAEDNQKESWRYKADSAVIGSPLLTDSQIIFSSENGNLVALDYTGKMIYNKKLSEKLYGTPVVSGENIIVGTTVKENIIIALDSNGNQVWSLTQPK